jgi:hypothetical protein
VMLQTSFTRFTSRFFTYSLLKSFPLFILYIANTIRTLMKKQH